MATVVIDWEDVKAIADNEDMTPALDAVSEPKRAEFMASAAAKTEVKLKFLCTGFIRFVGQAEHDDYVKQMQANWTAHIVANTKVGPAGDGARTTEGIGGVSASQNQPVNNPTAEQGHLEYVYGRAFYTLYKDYEELLNEAKKRSSVAFGNYSSGSLKGFPVVVPSC